MREAMKPVEEKLEPVKKKQATAMLRAASKRTRLRINADVTARRLKKLPFRVMCGLEASLSG